MLDFFSKLFHSGDFVSRRQCGDWSAGLMWTHIVADGLIWLCYMAIPITLIYFIWRRGGDTPFPRLFWMFGLFIVSCGFTHFIDAFVFVSPLYRLSAVVKVITALSSLATVVALIQIAPAALTLPGLKALNVRLTKEIREKEEAERQVRTLNRELNYRVGCNSSLRRICH